MKKLYLVLLCLIAAVTSLSAKQVWLDNTSTNWGSPAVYYWGGSNPCASWEKALPLTQDGTTGIWGATIPDDVTGMKFRNLANNDQSAGNITEIPDNGLWVGTATAASDTYTPGGSQVTESKVYLPNSTNGWSTSNESWHFATTDGKVFTFGPVDIAGGFQFKIYDDGSWLVPSLSGTLAQYLSTPDNILFADGEYTGVTFTYTKGSGLEVNGKKAGELPPAPVLPWTGTLKLNYDSGNGWKVVEFTTDEANSRYIIENLTVGAASFQFTLQASTPTEFRPGVEVTPGTPASGIFAQNNSNFKASGFTAGDIYNVIITLADDYSDGSILFEKVGGEVPPAPATTVVIRGETFGWTDGLPFTLDEETGLFTHTFATFDTNAFKLAVDGEWLEGMNLSAEAAKYIAKSGNDWAAKSALENVTFIYNAETKTLDLKMAPVDNHTVIMRGETFGWTESDGVKFTFDPATGFYTHTFATFDTNMFKMVVDGEWIADKMTLTDEAAKLFERRVDDDQNINWAAKAPLSNVVITYNPENHVFDAKADMTPVLSGTYPFGNKISLMFRNDADATMAFEELAFEFDKWNAETNPTGLEVWVAEFRADAREIPFYLKNDQGIIFDNAQNCELLSFYNYITIGENTSDMWNRFTGLTLGEKYRVVIKANPGDKAENSFIGIFPSTTKFPWGTEAEGLRIHSNLNEGVWPGTNGAVNISEGPELTYNANTGIWYYDFTPGAATALNRDENQKGWEFTFTDMYGIQWYKNDQELVYGDWQPGALTVQTEDNDRNFYILEGSMQPGKSYRIQLRQNPATGEWEMRLTETPVFTGKLYIAADGSDYADAVEMEIAKDVQNNDIPGLYIHTMAYPEAGFRISTANGSDFLNNLYSMFADNRDAVATIGTPYAYVDRNEADNQNSAPWTVAGDPQMVTVLVNYNTGDVTVYSPHIEVAFVNRHVRKMDGRFDAEAMGVDAAQVTNHVEGSSAEHPVVFDRMNHIIADVNITHRYFDSECLLTINSATINGLPVDGMDGLTGDECLVNHLQHIPYAGHLTLDDGQDVNATYLIEVNYTIEKNGVAKTGVATYEYEPNFQPYFVRPRPIADDTATEETKQSMRIRIGVDNDDYKAFIMRSVRFSGNVFDTDENNTPIYHDYRGNGNLDDAKVAVYPGFKVLVFDNGTEVEQPAGHHIPVSGSWTGRVGDFYLPNYIAGSLDSDWSSEALLEGKLPVLVNTNCSSIDEDPDYEYHIFAHYPVYSVGGGVRVAETPRLAKARAGEATVAAGQARVDNVVRERVYSDAFERDSETTGVESVVAGAAEGAEAEYFDLQGIRVAHPEAGRIYIVRQGTQVSKIRF